MARNAQTITVAGLARFFPDASPVRMRFQLARLIAGSASLADCVPLKSLHFPPLALFGQNAPVSTWGKAMLIAFPRIDAADRARGRMGLTAILLHNVKQPEEGNSE